MALASSTIPLPTSVMADHHSPEAKPVIQSARVDHVVSLAKGVFGALPVVGPLVAEVIGAVIPNQRVERITRFLQVLEQRVEGIERTRLEEAMNDEEFIDLLEDGMHQASRALSDERKERIASLLKNSITEADLSHAEEKRLLRLLGELTDPELIILRSHSYRPGAEDRRFRELHEAVLTAPRVYIGAPEKELDRAAIYKTYRRNLASLGLLRPKVANSTRTTIPDIDPETGTFKVSSYEVTALGRLLLRYLDLPVE